MADNPEDFGEFGTPAPPRKGFSFKSFFRLLLITLVLLLIPVSVYLWRMLQGSFAEQNPPVLRVLNAPPGIGLEASVLQIEIEDEGAGVDEVIVRAEQGAEVRTLFKMRYESAVKKEVIEVPLKGKADGFREGTVRISATAFDRSFWSNSASISLDLEADFRKPRIEVVSKQHNAVRGGVELVFYRILGDQDGFSGVAVGSELYPGFLARKLDSDFEQAPDVYFSFFAIPRKFDEEQEAVQVVARDTVGNTSFASIFYRVRNRKYQSRTQKVDAEKLESLTTELFPLYLRDKAKVKGLSPEEYVPAVRAEEFIDRFELLVTDYARVQEAELKHLFAKPMEKRLWNDKFSRPASDGRRELLNFGDTLRYQLGEQQVGRKRMAGFSYRLNEGEEVKATNRGKVAFAGRLGLKGYTLILDHGFGLSTVYSHLKEINRLEGDEVAQGETIATSGSSGLAFYPQLGFEFRLHGTPVRAAEWWDENWLRGHIEDKIASAKTLLGIKSRKTP